MTQRDHLASRLQGAGPVFHLFDRFERVNADATHLGLRMPAHERAQRIEFQSREGLIVHCLSGS